MFFQRIPSNTRFSRFKLGVHILLFHDGETSYIETLSYRNQFIDLLSKSMNRFLYFYMIGTSIMKELGNVGVAVRIMKANLRSRLRENDALFTLL